MGTDTQTAASPLVRSNRSMWKASGVLLSLSTKRRSAPFSSASVKVKLPLCSRISTTVRPIGPDEFTPEGEVSTVTDLRYCQSLFHQPAS